MGLLAPAAAQATVTGTVSGSDATLTSDGLGDSIVIGTNGGANLAHDLPTGAGAGQFASNVDFDSGVAGDQTIPNAGASSLVVNGNAGNDSLVVGTLASPTADIAAPVTFDGGSETDTFEVDDTADGTARTATITATTVTGAGAPRTYGNVETLTFRGGNGADTDTIAATATGTTTNLLAGGADDTVAMGAGVTLNGGTLDGGAGTNTLDDSAASSNLTVNLTTGTATGTGGIAGFANVTGGGGADAITGNNTANTLAGGGGDDGLTGAQGADTLTGGTENDTMTWNNGDGSDVVDGNDGADTAVVNGSTSATGDDIQVGPGAGGRVSLQRVNLGLFSLDIGTTETLQVNGLDGDDTIDGSAGSLNGLIGLAFNGGLGNDALFGSDSPDALDGGGGMDLVDAGPGPDAVQGGSGLDTVVGGPGVDGVHGGSSDDLLMWNSGDGSDTLDGDSGDDFALVNGSPGADTFTYGPSATDDRVNVTQTAPGPSASLDIGTTENLQLNGFEGEDTITGMPGLAEILPAVVLFGGDGSDSLTGSDEDNLLAGGPGNDALTGGGGENDAALFDTPSGVTADLAAGTATGEGNDTLATIEQLLGSPGPDTLLGDGAFNFIEGGPGADIIDGRDNVDFLSGDEGNDDVRSRDNSPDFDTCGDGVDKATVDAFDSVDADCETIDRGGSSTDGPPPFVFPPFPFVPPPPPSFPVVPITPPPAAGSPAGGVVLGASATVAANGTARIGTIANPPTVSARATLSGVLPARLAVPAAKKRKAKKPVTVAAGQASAAGGATTPLTVRLGAKAKKALKRHASLKVTATVVAVGADGATATVTRAITLKRGAKPKRKKR